MSAACPFEHFECLLPDNLFKVLRYTAEILIITSIEFSQHLSDVHRRFDSLEVTEFANP
jgi:hypothetical protein